ncbi:MAG: ABC transporter ATP-binding protein [Epsilonproteobacteria bacterium]|nr:ABC transporter ATP-binding protein [Campylobacterota bacterium]
MITIKSILKEINRHKKILILANIISIISILLSIPVPLLIPKLIDEVVLGKEGWITSTIDQYITVGSPEYYILVVLIVTIFLRAISLVLNIIHIRLFTKIAKDVSYKIRKRLLEHLKVVSMSEYDVLGSGSVASKVITDVDTIDKFIASGVGEIIVETLTIIGVASIIFYLNWQLALVILILNPLALGFFLRVFKNIAKIKKQENKSIEVFQNSLIESLELYNLIRVQNREEYFLKEIDKKAREIRDKAYLYGLKSEVSLKFAQMLIMYSHDTFRAVGILMVFWGSITIGEMLAIFAYAWVIMKPMDKLMNFTNLYFNAKSSIARLNEILELDIEPQYKPKINPFEGKKSASIRLKDVSFSYDKSVKVLDNLNLEIKEGEKVAIIGETGSGKSTLAQILIGLYPIDSGEIFYNGVEIKDIGYRTIRENVGFVIQSPMMFNNTLRFNLTLGKDYSDEQIFKALKIAQLYDFVKGLEKGLDTIVGKNGTKLSGGQKQRLSIARVLLDNPKVIIFDESTSSLDNQTEDRLLEALESYISDKTIITIAHRQNSIEKADRIIDLSRLR